MTEERGLSQRVTENAGSENTYSFTKPHPLNDVVVSVNGQRFHLNKSFLAMHSRVFYAMFFSDFSERSNKEVVLKDVDADAFAKLLSAMCPPCYPLTEADVEDVLKLADMYQIQHLVDRCEDCLAQKANNLAKKFLLSEQYRLPRLQEWCLSQLSSLEEVQAMENKEEYRQLSDKLKVAMLERAVTDANSRHFRTDHSKYCIDMRCLMRSNEYAQLSSERKMAMFKLAGPR